MSKFDVNEFQNQVNKAIDEISFYENLKSGEITAYGTNLTEIKQKAEDILFHQDIKPYICPSLTNITNDIKTVANSITPSLVTAILAGTLTIPLNPVIFGYIAILIVKEGISSFCSDLQDK